jgi:hypothetical protein
MYYELATLDTVIFGGGKAAPAIEAWVKAGAGTLRGAWGTDLGRLNRVYLLRSFDDPAALAAERERALRSADPFGCADLLVGLKMESYKGADFRPGCLAGALGPVYEIRTYPRRADPAPRGVGAGGAGARRLLEARRRHVRARRPGAVDPDLAVRQPRGAHERPGRVGRRRHLAAEGRPRPAPAGDGLRRRPGASLLAARVVPCPRSRSLS